MVMSYITLVLQRGQAPLVGRTLAISCEAVPASEMVRRGHEPALLPRNGAGESFVSFIALFGSVVGSLDWFILRGHTTPLPFCSESYSSFGNAHRFSSVAPQDCHAYVPAAGDSVPRRKARARGSTPQFSAC